VLLGAPLALAPLAATFLLLAPIGASSRPEVGRVWWVMAALAGLFSALTSARSENACGRTVFEAPVEVEGRFLATPRGGSGPFALTGGCPSFTAVVGASRVPAGRLVRLSGEWREGRSRPWFRADDVREPPSRAGGSRPESWRWTAVRWRDDLVDRIDRLYGARGPLIAGLTLARREGLPEEVRAQFAAAGIAHLFAISGFHVGIIAGVVLVLLRATGVRARPAALAAAGAAWAYVGFIGFPDAAARAACILSAVGLSRARGRPGARWGPLGSALLVLIVTDPTGLREPGFQLSFAGAAGLTAWSGALSATVQRLSRGRCPRAMAMGLAAGLAATTATLPFVAWHFERVSLVGIPATLLATPLVTLALVGALASLALDFVSHTLASVLAGGTGVVVAALEAVTAWAASLPWASVWTTRPTVVAAMAGVTGATLLARHPRVGGRARRGMVVLYAVTGAVAWPVLLSLQGRGSAEVLMIDVGQGDAIALRSPGGRWVLVDAGPAADAAGEAGHPVVRALRSRGVTRLDALILTHPDLDHVGGAAAVLRALDVGVVYDPGLAAGKQAFLEALDAAAERGVPWLAARAGEHIQLDGLQLRVLHPPDGIASGGESNASSVVLHASFGAFDVLLTGDAYKEVDRLLAPDLPAPLEVLKVGHHGSDTSTDPLLLDAVRPEVALVSVGRYNRYGHPAPEVLERLRSSGSRIRRTDVDGSISVLGRSDGSYYVTTGR